MGPLFKGREEVIEKIRVNLSGGSEKATANLAKQAIHGLGGIGKTRLAVEYAWQCMKEYTACLFVVADTPEHLQSSLAELCSAQILDLPEKEAH